jgi:hypothetical protein
MKKMIIFARKFQKGIGLIKKEKLIIFSSLALTTYLIYQQNQIKKEKFYCQDTNIQEIIKKIDKFAEDNDFRGMLNFCNLELEKNPTLDYLLLTKAVCEYSLGESKNLKILHDISEKEGLDSDTLFLISQTYLWIGQVNLAITFCQKSIDMNNVKAFNSMGN